MTDPVLAHCADLARTYGRGPSAVVAVHEVSCEVTRGARIAVSGPSGCGKSTLLHLMAGLDAPTAGRVAWPGLAAPPPDPTQLGMVFQTPNLLPDLDVVDNVALPLMLTGTRRGPALEIAARTVAMIGMAGLAGALPQELSGGQAQRIAIARAIAARPALILADEPTGQLDHETGAHVLSVLIEVADSADGALVIATHDPTVTARMTAHWQMHDGTLRVERQAGAR